MHGKKKYIAREYILRERINTKNVHKQSENRLKKKTSE